MEVPERRVAHRQVGDPDVVCPDQMDTAGASRRAGRARAGGFVPSRRRPAARVAGRVDAVRPGFHRVTAESGSFPGVAPGLADPERTAAVEHPAVLRHDRDVRQVVAPDDGVERRVDVASRQAGILGPRQHRPLGVEVVPILGGRKDGGFSAEPELEIGAQVERLGKVRTYGNIVLFR